MIALFLRYLFKDKAISTMPTVIKIKGYRFFFFSMEGNEPPHIHIEHGDKIGKFWLNPISLASSYGFRSHELAKLRLLVIEHRELFLETWYGHFGN